MAQTALKRIAPATAIKTMSNARAKLAETTSALIETSELMTKNRHDVLLKILGNARVNAAHHYQTFRDVLASESLSESLDIQRDALREALGRNFEQVRDVASLAVEGSKASLKPVKALVSNAENIPAKTSV